jgi:uncharacterized Ntn-hydrolase superfamily protein
MTYSIVARDPASGALGVAVQSCYFTVGPVVCWARAGVGAVATQALAEPAYGPTCLGLLADGASAAEALGDAWERDPGHDVRQVAVVDAAGGGAARTGALCIDYAGDQGGEGYRVQANMMASDRVWPAMAEAFESAPGPLTDRLLAALDAAEAAGGDARGRMSAAMLVVDGERRDDPWAGVLVDVRVDHHPEPLGELRRLVRNAGAFRACDRGEHALFSGDPAGALAAADEGLAVLPEEGNLHLLRAGALLMSGRVDEGIAEARALVATQPSWAVVLRSVASTGLFPLPTDVDLDDVLGAW